MIKISYTEINRSKKVNKFNAILSNGQVIQVTYAFYSLTNRWEFFIKFTDKVFYRSFENSKFEDSEDAVISKAKEIIESMQALFTE